MPRKVFDVNCKSDVLELFERLDKVFANVIYVSKFCDVVYVHSKDCLCLVDRFIDPARLAFDINFRDKIEITRPANEEEWIGKLCWFWNDGMDNKIGILNLINETKGCFHYMTDSGNFFKYCVPVKLQEIEEIIYKPKQ